MDTDAASFLQFVASGNPAREEDLLRELRNDIADRYRGEFKVFFETAAAQTTGDPDKSAGAVAEWVGVTATAGPVLIDLLRFAAEWARRAKNPVRVKIGDDVLILDNASADQQDRIIEAFLDRHRRP